MSDESQYMKGYNDPYGSGGGSAEVFGRMQRQKELKQLSNPFGDNDNAGSYNYEVPNSPWKGIIIFIIVSIVVLAGISGAFD